MSDRPQAWRQADIEERDARIKELESRLVSAVKCGNEVAMEWQKRCDELVTQRDALRSIASKVVEQAWKVPPSLTDQIPAIAELSAELVVERRGTREEHRCGSGDGWTCEDC